MVWHDLDDAAREHLEAAALLSNVGLWISHSRHHQHSYYVIRELRAPHGLHRPRGRGDRPGRPLSPQEPFGGETRTFAARDEPAEQVVRTLAGILRVAIGLDRAHRGSVGSLRCVEGEDGLVIEIEPAAGADTTVEVWSADERKGLLAEVLGRPVEVRTAEGPQRVLTARPATSRTAATSAGTKRSGSTTHPPWSIGAGCTTASGMAAASLA